MKRPIVEMKAEVLKKFVAAKLNHFGLNQHGFWSDGVWVMDEKEATLYNSIVKAQEPEGCKHKCHPIMVNVGWGVATAILQQGEL